MGETGCVAWMFDTVGLIEIDKKAGDEETIMEIALESGAEDFKVEDECFEVYTNPKDFDKVVKNLKEKNIAIITSNITKIPQTKIKLEGRQAEQMLKLMDRLDSHDDVQNVYANFDIADDIYGFC